MKREQRLPTGTAPAAAWRIAAEHCSSQPRTADPHPWSELLLPPLRRSAEERGRLSPRPFAVRASRMLSRKRSSCLARFHSAFSIANIASCSTRLHVSAPLRSLSLAMRSDIRDQCRHVEVPFFFKHGTARTRSKRAGCSTARRGTRSRSNPAGGALPSPGRS